MYAILPSAAARANVAASRPRLRILVRATLLASSAFVLTGCAQNNISLSSFGGPEASSEVATSSLPAATNKANASPAEVQAELGRATAYWAEAYAKNPMDAQAAYNYVRNLKAMGEKQRALRILQTATQQHPGDKKLLGEYGRLALEFDQISVAQKVLEAADDPANPDWRVVSARGTALSKQGHYKEAIPFYERAYALAPDRASVLNNLALAYTMDGKPEKAEPLMRRAAATANADERVKQNLSLVLGVQGKYDEAKAAARHAGTPASAADNVDYLRSIVKAEAKVPATSPGAWQTSVTTR